jgi:hypothetical protein
MLTGVLPQGITTEMWIHRLPSAVTQQIDAIPQLFDHPNYRIP